MFRRSRWKALTALTAVLVAGMVVRLLVGKTQERKEYVSRVDPTTGYRCRFTVSTGWKHDKPPQAVATEVQFEVFTLPPSSIRHWMNDHLLHGSSPDPPELEFLDGGSLGGWYRLVQGYPEYLSSSTNRIIRHRHLKNDGYPATIVTTGSPDGRPWDFVLVIYVPDHSKWYMFQGSSEPSDFSNVEHELNEIIASFHIERAAVSADNKRWGAGGSNHARKTTEAVGK